MTAERSVASARAAVREVAWVQRAATTVLRSAGREAGTLGLDALVIDLDAHLLACHSEQDTSGQNASSPTASAGYLGRKTGRGFRDYS